MYISISRNEWVASRLKSVSFFPYDDANKASPWQTRRGKLDDVMYRVQMQRNLRKIPEAYRIERWGGHRGPSTSALPVEAECTSMALGNHAWPGSLCLILISREPSKQEVEEQSIELRLRGFPRQR